MSYSFRNRPKLSDKYRGKSGDEILNELKKQIDEDRKMFFESSPSWNTEQSPGSFSRAGNPLDDMMSRGRQDIRSHLDDLAQRHPEFADHLRCPPWGGEMGSHGTWGRKRRGSGSSGDDSESQSPGPSGQQQSSDEASPSRGRVRQGNLAQHGLRNTVDIGQQQQQNLQQQGDGNGDKRGQRSWSAPPPDSRTTESPRYVSRLDIPMNAPSPSASGTDQGKPPMAPKHNPQPSASQPPQQPPPQQSSKPNQSGGNVRHIPIFVEGRDEPLLPKDARATEPERVFAERVPPQATFNYGRPSQFTARPQPATQQQAPPPVHTTSFAQNAAPPRTRSFQQPPPQQFQSPPQQFQPPPPPHQFQPPPQQFQPPPQQQVPTQQPKEQTLPQAPKPPMPNDPILQVQAVQKDVNDLKLKVESFSGTSRTDKDYIFLDEMLTRNLLKLDNIETEGKENVRLARKEVIRNIQKCISILESKVPNLEDISDMNKGVSDETGDTNVEMGEDRVCEEKGNESQEGLQEMETDVAIGVLQHSNSKRTLAEGQEKMDVELAANATGDTLSISTEAEKVAMPAEAHAAAETTVTSTTTTGITEAQMEAVAAEGTAKDENNIASQPCNIQLDENVNKKEESSETTEVGSSSSEALTIPSDASESLTKKDDKKGNGTSKKSGKSPKSPRKGKKAV